MRNGVEILIAEDSPTQAEQLKDLLVEHGYSVTVATNGKKALAEAKKRKPALIITDILMPEMDGYTLSRKINSDETLKDTPVILLTTLSDPQDIIKGLECGADNFIRKPYDEQSLLSGISRILANLELRKSEHIQTGAVISVAGKTHVITSDRQQILDLLISTYEQILRLNEELRQLQERLEEKVKERTAALMAEITERQRVEDELSKLSSVVEQTADTVTITNKDGVIEYVNPAFEQQTGYAKEEAIGQTPRLLKSDQHEQRYYEDLWKTILAGEVFRAVMVNRKKDGTSYWEEKTITPLRDREGNITHFVSTGKDITERKQAEEEIQRQRETLFQTEKLAAMGSLLAGVAHELNNPLAVVMGQTALLRQAVGEGPQAARAERIGQAAERCARIVKNFLALARQRPPERQQVQLNQVVKEAVELLAYPLRVDNVKVVLDLAPDLPEIWGDPHQLHQVVVNLVTNAHHAMREVSQARQLTLATRSDPSGGRVSLGVADTGPGIPPEIQRRIFEAFFTTKPLGQGTGLGLSLCHGIIEGHGGSIRVESQPGQGATFVIELPVKDPQGAGPEAPAREELPVLGGKAILVVDDEPEVAGLLAEMLTGEGHQVETAPNGLLALNKLQGRAYDLILSDMRMPALDGPGLYREVERRFPPLHQRVIFLTGDTLGSEIMEFLEQTGAPSLAKPFTLDELRQAVQRALQGQ